MPSEMAVHTYVSVVQSELDANRCVLLRAVFDPLEIQSTNRTDLLTNGFFKRILVSTRLKMSPKGPLKWAQPTRLR
jgi:hypothetical protein